MIDSHKVTVCGACLTAACWHWDFPCDQARAAGLVDMPVGELRKLNREHSSYWSAKTMAKVYGVGSDKHMQAVAAELESEASP